MKLPAFQFYPGDWLKDPAVRSVSLAARGLWIDMLCLMHESSRRGYLQHETGGPVLPEQLARMAGCDTAQVESLLSELESVGVFSRAERGVIYSRRMSRDEAIRAVRSEAGKLGAPYGIKGGRPKRQITANETANITAKLKEDNPPSSSSSSSQCIQSVTRGREPPADAAGNQAARSEILALLERWLNVSGKASVNWGPAITWLERIESDSALPLAKRCVEHAITAPQAKPHAMAGAVRYAQAIYERCRQHDCEPGDFGDSHGKADANRSRIRAKPGKFSGLAEVCRTGSRVQEAGSMDSQSKGNL